MAGRPPHEIGTHGDIWCREAAPGVHEARARFRDASGKTRLVSRSGPTEAKAKAVLRAALRDRRAQVLGKTGELTPESPLSALIERWLESLEPRRRSVTGTRDGSLADGTVDTYRDIATRIVTPGLGGVRLRELTTQRVDGYLAGCSAHKRHIRTVLMQSCSLGVRWNLLEYNPVRETEPAPRPKSDKRTLTPEDVGILLARAREWTARKPGQGGPQRGVDMVELVTLLMATGERTGEVLALRWADVEHLDDTDQPCAVTIAGTVTRHAVREPFPKSAHGYRRLVLPEFGRQALLTQRGRGLPFDLVFPSRTGTPRWPNNVNRSWREIRGEEYAWVTPRTFRKTVGTAIEREHGADAAAAQLGHSTPDVTRKHYIDRAITVGDHTAALDGFAPIFDG